MQTETEYEELILQELRAFPQEAIPEVIHILRSVRKGISITRKTEGKQAQPSGLCGIWKDDRNAAVTDRYYGATHDRGYGATRKWPKAGLNKWLN